MSTTREMAFKIDAKIAANFNSGFARAQQALSKITGQLGKMTRAEDKVGAHARKMREHTEKSFGGFGKLAEIGAMLLSLEALRGGYEAVKKAGEDEENMQVRLNTLMGNVKGTTAANVDAIRRYAVASERYTTIGRDVTEMGASQLATFQLHGESLRKIMPAMQDFLVGTYKMNVNQEQAQLGANMLGKALTGLPKGLQRVGVTMSDAQVKLLKSGNEMQRVATLTQVIESNYGNLARKMAETSEGRSIRLGRQWIALQALLWEKIKPAQEAVMGYMVTTIPKLIDLVENYSAKFGKFYGIAKKYTQTTILPKMANLAKLYQPSLNGLGAAFVRLGATFVRIWKDISPAVLKLWNGALKPLFQWVVTKGGPGLVNFLTGVVNVVNATIGGITSAGEGIGHAWDKLQQFYQGSIAFFQKWHPLILTLSGPVGWITEFMIQHWDSVKKAAVAIIPAIKTAFSGLFTWLTNSPVWKIMEKVVNWAGSGIVKAAGVVGNVAGKVESVRSYAISRAGSVAYQGLDRANNYLGGKGFIPSTALQNLARTNMQAGKIGVPAFATGGIVTRPTLALVGERGPEAILPLSARGAGNMTIHLAPVFNFTGGGTPEANAAAVRTTLPEFERMLREVLHNGRRISYAG